MSRHGMLKYFRPISHKKNAPEDKDPPEGKKLSNLSGPKSLFIEKLYPHRHRGQLLPVVYNADVTRVLKQAERSFT